jgi:predicted kinase
MAAGKSTVAQLVAERLPRSVHLRGDAFRRMIVRGRAEPSPRMSSDAAAQLTLRYELAAQAAVRYADAGFTVVYQDVIVGPALRQVATLLSSRPLAVVVLTPDADTLREREEGRAKAGYGGAWTVAALDDLLRYQTPRIGLWLDTTTMTAQETADAVLRQLAAARVA